MGMSRRSFVIMTAGTAAAVCAGCASRNGAITPSGYSGSVAIGTTADYPHDGVYDRFIRYRFFVLRRAALFTALSAICPHRRCTVRNDPEKGFICPCHGATFVLDGRVTGGPATSGLPHLRITEATTGQLIVHPEESGSPG